MTLVREPDSRIRALGLLAIALLTGLTGCARPTPDVAVWVYGAHRWSDVQLAAELSRLPGEAQRLYLSVEDGPRLLVDDPRDAARLAQILDATHDRFGLVVEAMLLQDPSWAFDPEGSATRAERVVAFHAARRALGRPGFAGLHFDIEPHTEEAWACGSAEERRGIVRALQGTFARIAQRVRRLERGAELHLTAALPWWLGLLAEEVPEAVPSAWLDALDEVVLMVYGDPGGPLAGGSPDAVLARVDDGRLWAHLPPGRGVRVGLATYEYRDAPTLARAVREVSAGLADRPGFRGVAVFAHGQPFDAPLVTALAGQVVAPGGRPVAGARIRAGGRETLSNRCGLFGLRGLPAPSVTMTVEADGFATLHTAVAGLVPGRVRELGAVVLERGR